MLLRNNTLKHLSLAWNSIRGDSAVALAQSLVSNEALQTLNLAHNAFANLGAQYLGMALGDNKVRKCTTHCVKTSPNYRCDRAGIDSSESCL